MNQTMTDIDVRCFLEKIQELLGKFGSERFSISLHDQSDEPNWQRGRLDCSGLDAKTNLHFISAPHKGIGGSTTLNVSNLHGNRIELALAEYDEVILANSQFGESQINEVIVFGNSWFPAPTQLVRILAEHATSVLENMRTSDSPVIHTFWGGRLLLQYGGRFWTQCK